MCNTKVNTQSSLLHAIKMFYEKKKSERWGEKKTEENLNWHRPLIYCPHKPYSITFYIYFIFFISIFNFFFLFILNFILQKISERAFDGLNVLRTLNLANNKLTYLERGIFTGTPALVLLDLSNNRLETVTQYNIQPLLDNLVNATSVLELTGMYVCFFHFHYYYSISFHNKIVCVCLRVWEK